jgi:hypothetical protein
VVFSVADATRRDAQGPSLGPVYLEYGVVRRVILYYPSLRLIRLN